MPTWKGMLRRLEKTAKADRMTLEGSCLSLAPIPIEVTENIVSVDSRCRSTWCFSLFYTIGKQFEEIFQSEVDVFAKIFVVSFKRKFRGITANSKYSPIFQLVTL